MPKVITPPQGLLLDLIRMSSYNDFDGPGVVDSLIANPKLWQSVIMVQDPVGITLRDLRDGYHNVSTMLIKTSEDKRGALRDLVQDWGADKISWVKNPLDFMGGGEGAVLSVWWD